MRLIEEIVEEATKLREHLTAQEKENLKIENFDPNDVNHCIYGQIAGDCRNERAVELLELCAKPIIPELPEEWESLEEVEIREPNLLRPFDSQMFVYSPIEAYILTEDADIEGLMDYLKGKTDKLEI